MRTIIFLSAVMLTIAHNPEYATRIKGGIFIIASISFIWDMLELHSGKGGRS